MIVLVKFCKKFKVETSPPFPCKVFSFFFSFKRLKVKRNPSNQKVVHLQKYRFHARKVEDSKHAIYDVCERVWCCLTKSRPPSVRRPGPSQIKMYGLCRLFRAMYINFKISAVVVDSYEQKVGIGQWSQQIGGKKIQGSLRKKSSFDRRLRRRSLADNLTAPKQMVEFPAAPSFYPSKK